MYESMGKFTIYFGHCLILGCDPTHYPWTRDDIHEGIVCDIVLDSNVNGDGLRLRDAEGYSVCQLYEVDLLGVDHPAVAFSRKLPQNAILTQQNTGRMLAYVTETLRNAR